MEEEELVSLSMVGEIFINHKLPKTNLKITIKQPVENHFDFENYIAYNVETDIKTISNLMTETFSLDFEEEKGKKSVECYFKKTNKNPLYLLCLPEMGTYSLSEIKEERILNQIHKQYNFYIQPTKNNDKITIDGKGSLQMYAMLKTLDFYTADEIKLDFIMKNPRYTQNIRLDPNASKDLACEEVGKRIKRCIVPKSHFKNKKMNIIIYII